MQNLIVTIQLSTKPVIHERESTAKYFDLNANTSCQHVHNDIADAGILFTLFTVRAC